MNLPATAEGLLDRTIDEHKNSLELEKISIFSIAKQIVTRTGKLTIPVMTYLPRDPALLPQKIVRT